MGSASISRRTAIIRGTSLLTVAMVGNEIPMAEGATVVAGGLSAAGRAVSLTPSYAPTFWETLNSVFPGLSADPGFQQISQVATLVTNVSGPALIALGVTWSISTSPQVFQKTLFSYVPGGTNLLMSATVPYLAPGQTKLLVPLFSISAARYSRQTSLNWDAIMSRSEWQQLLLWLSTSNPNQVSISLDSAVYGDHAAIGPDTANLADHLHLKRNAEHDEAICVLKIIKRGGSRDDVAAKLRQDRTIEGVSGVGIPGSPRALLYCQSRALQASALQSRLSNLDVAAMTPILAKIRCQPRTNIKYLGR